MELRADLIPREYRILISNHVVIPKSRQIAGTSVQNTDHTHSTKGKANNDGRSSQKLHTFHYNPVAPPGGQHYPKDYNNKKPRIEKLRGAGETTDKKTKLST